MNVPEAMLWKLFRQWVTAGLAGNPICAAPRSIFPTKEKTIGSCTAGQFFSLPTARQNVIPIVAEEMILACSPENFVTSRRTIYSVAIPTTPDDLHAINWHDVSLPQPSFGRGECDIPTLQKQDILTLR